MTTRPERKPNWTGDLHDDCTAIVGDLMLRAEKTDKGTWWWAVYNKRGGVACDQLASSYDRKPYNATTGAQARAACEAAASKIKRESDGNRRER